MIILETGFRYSASDFGTFSFNLDITYEIRLFHAIWLAIQQFRHISTISVPIFFGYSPMFTYKRLICLYSPRITVLINNYLRPTALYICFPNGESFSSSHIPSPSSPSGPLVGDRSFSGSDSWTQLQSGNQSGYNLVKALSIATAAVMGLQRRWAL